MPGSPNFGGVDRIDMSLGDVMIRDELDLERDDARGEEGLAKAASAIRGGRPEQLMRDAEQDVCFPPPDMSELGDDEMPHRGPESRGRIRRRRTPWPDLSIFEEWKQIEKEDRTEERRVKTITEPQLINGRLRPVRKGWFETDEDVPYRFTYFNEEFQSTIHSQTISELVQPGSGFQELFIPEPRVLSDDETESDDEVDPCALHKHRSAGAVDDESKLPPRQTSMSDTRKDLPDNRRDQTLSPSLAAAASSGRGTPSGIKSPEDSANKISPSTTTESKPKPVRYGERPVWWLDVLCPTEAEMKVISKAFGIHPLTAEDIMLQEAREKVELFRHYYFVNYRTFDQDINSENYLEPVNMYVVVFREGVLSFHFSVTPHPANVRRRIRQLRDYLILSSDWISYALIDDITDVFQPLIQNIEDEVDEIDEAILQLHSVADKRLKDDVQAGQQRPDDTTTVADSSGDMLRRVGDCRKRVMSLYRLLGNKADVIKGFAKRCNERWEVAPRSEIGLYLGDIQDHIVTMTSNLGHYEK
jgi:magnesium transporter